MPGNPLQRGEYKQALSRIRGPLVSDPWARLTKAEQVGSFNAHGGFRDARDDCHVPVEWLTVSLHALEIQRFFDAPQDQIAALDRVELERLARSTLFQSTVAQAQANPTQPSEFRGSAYSLLKARITWTDDTANQTSVVVDVGGGVVASFPSPHVKAEFLLPEESVAFPGDPARSGAQTAPRPTLATGAPGLVLDTFLEASYTQSSSAPIGRRAARFTELLVLPADGGDLLVKIPQHTVEASVYGATDAFWSLEPALPGAETPLSRAVGGGGLFLEQPAAGVARWLRVVNNTGGLVNALAVFTLEF